ncbi:hypothetical protein V474_24265 [Novosphingobium barchaimii LL02]|uniref:Lipoprotein n=1 Tax=Novosphingobium barchaimii LL02 TaxID=1114963 RepID=A0A0J7XPD6_9SPHN|nr:hypothetical protein V474_24265 [Novosphingobium barchaimii LL02]
MKSVHIGALLLGAATALSGCKNEVEEAVKRNLVAGASAEFESVEQCSGDRKIYHGRVKAVNERGPFTGTETFFYGGGEVAFAGSPSFTRLMKWCYGTGDLAADESQDQGQVAPVEAVAASLQHKAIHQ